MCLSHLLGRAAQPVRVHRGTPEHPMVLTHLSCLCLLADLADHLFPEVQFHRDLQMYRCFLSNRATRLVQRDQRLLADLWVL